MSDLRTGLVEATRRAIDDWLTDADGNLDVGAIVDVQLGFLTDNADQWRDAAGWYTLRDTTAIADLLLVLLPDAEIIAALSDSRDTGEKP